MYSNDTTCIQLEVYRVQASVQSSDYKYSYIYGVICMCLCYQYVSDAITIMTVSDAYNGLITQHNKTPSYYMPGTDVLYYSYLGLMRDLLYNVFISKSDDMQRRS